MYIKISEEMRLCAFADFENIYVHYLEKNRLLIKVSETGYPTLLNCLPSFNKSSLEITYITDVKENGVVGYGEGKQQVFVRETISLENLGQQKVCREVFCSERDKPIAQSKIIYRAIDLKPRKFCNSQVINL